MLDVADFTERVHGDGKEKKKVTSSFIPRQLFSTEKQGIASHQKLGESLSRRLLSVNVQNCVPCMSIVYLCKEKSGPG